jgi:hypothetical protein
VGHWYQLTDEGKEAVEVLQVCVEFPQAVVIEQSKKLLFWCTFSRVLKLDKNMG